MRHLLVTNSPVFTVLCLTSLLTTPILSCQLQGDLCLWNLHGFELAQDVALNGYLTDNLNYITTHETTFHASLHSPIYERNGEESCHLNIIYKLQNNHSQLLVTQIYSQSTNDLLTIEPAHSVNCSAFGWCKSQVRIQLTDEIFKLSITAVHFSDLYQRPQADIKSIYLSGCTSKDVLTRSPDCIVSNGVFCPGWNLHFPGGEEELPFKWRAKEDYLILNSTAAVSEHKLMSLLSPTVPIAPKLPKDCQVTFEYKAEGYRRVYEQPTLYCILHFFDENEEAVYELPCTRIPSARSDNEWKSMVQPVNLSRLKFLTASSMMLDIYTYSKKRDGAMSLRNIRFSSSCLPQLKPSYIPLPQLNMLKSEINRSSSVTDNKRIYVANRETSYFFTACGAEGRLGPTAQKCDNHYSLSENFQKMNVSIDPIAPGVQRWKVPKTSTYNLILFGACGGYSFDSRETKGLITGTRYMKPGDDSDVLLWPSKVHIRANLTSDDYLCVVVGQSGQDACQKDAMNNKCVNENMTTDYGGGGGGGGGTWVYLDRDGELQLLAVAGGGAGVGRIGYNANLDYEKLLFVECKRENCSSRTNTRPGYGSSFQHDGILLRQDGRPATPNLTDNALEGGRNCAAYSRYFETSGGFGGGGGGCTAGGGGGGYKGGKVSLMDNKMMSGLRGDLYYNNELAIALDLDESDPFHLFSPDGSVEVTEQPPDCPTCKYSCRWLDKAYRNYECICESPLEVLTPDKTSCIRIWDAAAVKSRAKLDSKMIWMAIGIGLGGVLFVAVIIAAICLATRKKRHRHISSNASMKPGISLEQNPVYQKLQDYMPLIEEHRITPTSTIGKGNFSTVFEARWAQSDEFGSRENVVAVKKPKEDKFDLSGRSTKEAFLQEATMISSLDHPNIIKILGHVVYHDNSVGIVMNILHGGELKSFLRENRQPETPADHKLETQDLVKISYEISSALQYLEMRKIVHRDIAARNILLTEKGRNRVAVLSDFGLARSIAPCDYFHTVHTQVPVKWCAPETLKTKSHTQKSDVWAFGILMWEIFSYGEQPYPKIENYQLINLIVESRYTMDPPEGCPQPVASLMKKCWEYEPNCRPYFSFVCPQLNAILNDKQLMLVRESLGSSSSSGFYENLDSPGSASSLPLLTSSGHFLSDHAVNEREVLLADETIIPRCSQNHRDDSFYQEGISMENLENDDLLRDAFKNNSNKIALMDRNTKTGGVVVRRDSFEHDTMEKDTSVDSTEEMVLIHSHSTDAVDTNPRRVSFHPYNFVIHEKDVSIEDMATMQTTSCNL